MGVHREPVTAISSTESEIYSVLLCGLHCVYLRRMMDIVGYKQIKATAIERVHISSQVLWQVQSGASH